MDGMEDESKDNHLLFKWEKLTAHMAKQFPGKTETGGEPQTQTHP